MLWLGPEHGISVDVLDALASALRKPDELNRVARPALDAYLAEDPYYLEFHLREDYKRTTAIEALGASSSRAAFVAAMRGAHRPGLQDRP